MKMSSFSILFDCSKWRKADQCLKEKLAILAMMGFGLHLTNLLILLFVFWACHFIWFPACGVIIYPLFLFSVTREWIESLRYVRIFMILGMIVICLSIVYLIFIIDTDPFGQDKFRGANIYSFFASIVNLPIQVMSIFFLELFIQQMPDEEEEMP